MYIQHVPEPDRYTYEVLDICLSLHWHVTGACDPLSEARVKTLTDWLRKRLLTWTLPESEFDKVVKKLCEITLKEVDNPARLTVDGWL